MWLLEKQNYLTKLVIEKEEKNKWLSFFLDNFQLNTLKNNTFDLIQQLECNFWVSGISCGF